MMKRCHQIIQTFTNRRLPLLFRYLKKILLLFAVEALTI